jgi:DNA-directed RNA polymerase specialized sigma subunit
MLGSVVAVPPPHVTVAAPSPLTVWQQYASTRDPRLRDRLMFTLAPLVRCAGVDAAAGLAALLRAVETFDPARHGSIERWAWRVVRGVG